MGSGRGCQSKQEAVGRGRVAERVVGGPGGDSEINYHFVWSHFTGDGVGYRM